MAHRKGVIPKWSPSFAWCVGLIVSDGNMSPDGRHIAFVSKDLDLIGKFKKAIKLNVKIGIKRGMYSEEKKYYRIQFGNINLYEYFISIGITPNKSLVLKEIQIPLKYFWDFLRGCIDGDGNIDISYHRESSHPQLKVRIASGSKDFLQWLHKTIRENSKIKGGWIHKEKNVYALVFAKQDGLILLKLIYKNCGIWYLSRKKVVAKRVLSL